MPTPPQSGESKDKFISRCISYMNKEDKYPEKQGIAICYSMWEKKDESIEDRIDLFLEQGTIGANIDTTPVKPKKKKKVFRRSLQNMKNML